MFLFEGSLESSLFGLLLLARFSSKPRLFRDVRGTRSERHRHLVVALAGHEVDRVADDDRRRLALADLDLPQLLGRLGPGLGGLEHGGVTVAVGAAVLRPILGREGGGKKQGEKEAKHAGGW